ncbi:uncharacterized protein LOC135493098 [Lineus longissimus]|uniref:uncharacterized protein LOC135493098 n=1 Tax=Lineus longissimus TaxID=88925 RepID=UPI002B4E0FD7
MNKMDRTKNSGEAPQIIDVILKGGSPWGLSLKGGLETSSALVISKIEPGGRAAQEGSLRVGDLILYVNDIPCDSRAEAIGLVRSAVSSLSITVQRGGIDQNTTPRTTLFLKRFRDFREKETERLENQSKYGAIYQYDDRLPSPPPPDELEIDLDTDDYQNRFSPEPPPWQTDEPPFHRPRAESLPAPPVLNQDNRRLSYPVIQADSNEDIPCETMQVHGAKSTPNLNMDKYGYPRQFRGHHGGANKPYRDVNANPPPPVSRGRHGGVYNNSNSHSGSSHALSSLGGSGTVYEKDSRRNSASFGNSPFSSSYGQGYTNNAMRRESFSYKGRDRDSFSSNKGRDRDSFSSGISYRPYERSNYNRSKDYENLCDISTDYESGTKYQSRSSPNLSRNSRDSIASDYSVRTLINISPEPPAVPPRPSNVDIDTGYAPAPPVRDTSSSYGRYNHNHDRTPSWPPEAHVDQMQKSSLNATIGTESSSEIRKPRASYPFQASYDKPLKPEPEPQVVENDSLTSPKKPKFQTDIIHHAKVAKVTNIENELDFVKPYPSLDPKSETEVRNLYNSPPSYLYPNYESGAHKYCDRDFRIPSPPQMVVAPPNVQQTQMNPPTVEALDQKQLDQMIGEYVESYKAHHKKKSSSGYHDNTQVPRPNIHSMATSINAAANQKVNVSVIRSPNDPHNGKDTSRAFMYRPKPHYSTSTQTDDLSPIEQTAVPLRAAPMEVIPDDVFTDDEHNKSTNTDHDVPVLRNHRRSHQSSNSSHPTSFPSDSSRPGSSQTDRSSRPTSYAEYDMDKGVVTDRQSVSSERQSVTSDRQSTTSERQSLTSDRMSITSERQSMLSDRHSIASEQQSLMETEKPTDHPFKSIHDYSPSTAPLLRRLSEEYFNQTQRDANVRQLNDHPVEQTVPEGKELNLDDRRVISKKGPIVKRPIRFEEIDIPPPPWERGKRNEKRQSLDIPSNRSGDLHVSMETGKQVEANENEAAPSLPRRMMIRAGPNRMSMKKAYGIGDDSDIHPEPIFKTSRSTSNIPEEPLKEDKIDFMKRSESESQSLKAIERKLPRSSSEQFRPMNERMKNSGRQGSDPDLEHSRKSSDCSDPSDQAPVSGHNRWQNLSDPASQSSRSSTPRQSNEKRSNSDPMQKQLPYLSVSGKVRTPTSEGKRRVGSDPSVLDGEPDIINDTKHGPISTRSHGAYGSQDSGYRSDRTSDPQLKNLQQWGHLDKRAPYVDNMRSEEVYLAERSIPQTRMASTLPPGMDAPNFSKMSEYAEIDKHARSVSQDQGSLSKDQVNFRNRQNDHGEVPPPRPERPKSFGDQKFERLQPSALKSSPDSTNRRRPDSLATHSSLASPAHHRDRGYGFDGESQRQRREHAEDGSRDRNSYRLSYDKGLRRGDEAERPDSSTTVDGSPTKRGPVSKRSKTPESVPKTKEVDQSPYADVSRLSASVKGGDQAPPSSSSTGKGDQHKYEPYTPVSSEQVEQKPPILPPRLYRTKNTILQEKPSEGKDRHGHTHGNYDNIGEVEPTDAYADMLRQQAMRFTHPQSMNVLKYKSIPHNETVVTSRPVKPVERYQSVPESQPIKYHPAEPLTSSRPTDLDKLQDLRPLSTSSPKPTDENRISESEPKRKKSPSKSMQNLNYRASSPEFFFPPPPDEPPPPSKNFGADTSMDDLSLPLPPPPSETEMPSGPTVEPVRQVQREFAKPLTKYSSESYITNRSNNIPRRGYGGNYRRSDSGGFSASLAAQISPTDPHGDYVNLADPEPERKQPSPPKQLSYSPNSAFTNQITPRSAMENGDKEDYRRMPVSSQVAKFEKGDSLFKPIDHAPTYEAKSVIAKNVLQLTGKFGGSKDSLNHSTESLSRCSDGVSKSSESLDSVGGKNGDRRPSTPDRRDLRSSTPNRREFSVERKISMDFQDENVPPRSESPGRVRTDLPHLRKFSADVIMEKNQNNRTPPPVPVKTMKQETPNTNTENTQEVKTPDRNFDSPEGIISKEKNGMNADMIQNSPDTPFMNQLRSSTSNDRTVFREVTPPGEQNVTPQSQPAPQPTLPSSVHVRQKSQEEIECDEVIAKLANELKEKDRKLSEVISPPNTYKLPQDYYGDIFDKDVAGVSRRLVISPDRGAGSPAVQASYQDAQEKSESPLPPTSPYWVSPSAANLERKIREDGTRNEMMDNLGDDTASLDRKKEELIERIETKLKILREAKQSLSDDIVDNNALGKQVTKIVEQKLENPKELDKYKSYVDELDKIMHLLLKLAGRLARAENAVLSLPDDAAERERVSLISKRDKLSEQHEDAKKLKEGIDKRSKQVATYLRKDLTDEEFADYEVFVKMKSKLIMEEQEIEDKIILGEEQLKALSKSMLHYRDPDDLDFCFD